MKQMIMFGAETQLEKLTKMGDQLLAMRDEIDWEMFRDPIKKGIRKTDYSKNGRPAWDEVIMFKIVMLQQWYNMSDENTEYQINDCVSFCRLLGLEFGSKVPDKNAIWDFKQALADKEIDRKLFDLFNKTLEESGIITQKGSIVDATFVTADKRHTTKKGRQIA